MKDDSTQSPLEKLIEAFRDGQLADLTLIDKEFERVVREDSDSTILEAVELMENFLTENIADAV